MTQQNTSRRFSGVARLYGDSGLARFEKAHIIIIGIGGVGSWVVEALARNAIGKLTLIDMDVVAESNINRQLPALTSTLGRNKIDVMKQRILEINDQCEVITIDNFISQDNLQELISDDANYVIDCIDSSRIKAALIYHCKRRKIPIITLGGAGGQTNPELIKSADLSRTIHDPLLSKTRKLLRQKYGFSSNTKRRFSIPCVYSTEHMKTPSGSSSDKDSKANLSCTGGIGSSISVTATFGFIAASFVLNKLL